MKRPLDAIFFDIDDTLFSTTEFAEKARRAAVDAMIAKGLKASRESCLKELEEVLAEFTSNYDHHFDKVLQRLPAAATAGLNRGILVASGVVAYHDTKWRELRVYDDVYEILEWLAGTPLIRGIISAGWTIKQAEKVIRLKVDQFLTPSAIFFTDQIGISKPNPKLYRRVLEMLSLEPQRTMYVGDHPTHDIDPCNSIGMVTVRARRSGRHAQTRGLTEAAYEIGDFFELRTLLDRDFDLQGRN